MNVVLVVFSFLFLAGNVLAYKNKISDKLPLAVVVLSILATGYQLYSWGGYGTLLLLITLLLLAFTAAVSFLPKFFTRLHPLIWSQIAFFVQAGTFMLYRIEPNLARRHIMICLMGLLLIMPVYWGVKHFKTSYRYAGLYYLLAVFLLALNNETRYGATNWTRIGNIVYQPSEIVKILFSLFLASFLLRRYSRKIFTLASVLSFSLIGILVLQKDLGGAFIFFSIYVVITYMYSHNKVLLAGQFLLASGAAVASVFLFSHVKVRIISWLNPFEYAQKEGFQIIRSLEALMNGKWWGTGIGYGSPHRIPVVTSDFLFAAIGEEFGSIYLLLFVVHFLFLILLLYNQCLKSKSKFYFYTGTSLTTMIAIQGFLIMAGSSGMIPLTGVVLPFVSYGGSAMLGNFVIVGMIESMSKLEPIKCRSIVDVTERDLEVRQVIGLAKYIRILKFFICFIYLVFLGYLIWLFAFWTMPEVVALLG